MHYRSRLYGLLLATCLGLPLMAAGQVNITQDKALAGGISVLCDAPGFPITICTPGSYVLHSNLKVPANTDGIDLAVPNITIDLNGFAIIGPVTCTGSGATLSCIGSSSGSGIAETGSFVNGQETVRNGSVRGFGLLGVSLTGVGNIVDEVNASENMATGIFVWWGTVNRSTSSRNVSGGIVCFSGQVKSNMVSGNAGDGILLNRCTATDNATNYNGMYGLSGFHSLVSGNESNDNGLGDFFNEVGLVSPGDNSCSGGPC